MCIGIVLEIRFMKSAMVVRWLSLALARSLIGCALIVASPAFGAVAQVNIIDNAFSPMNIVVNVNDQVEWIWVGANLHSTTSSTLTASNTPLWDSNLQTTGFTFTQTFNSAGDFPYFCSNHGFTGDITVKAQTQTNVPPTVSITSPPNGAKFTAPWAGTIQATDSDSDGTVTKLQFFAGTNLLGTVTNPPTTVSFNVNNLAAGNYTLTAVATDNGGASTTSAGISIQVTNASPTNVPPTVSINSPTNGAVFAALWAGTIQATASDSDGTVTKVQFFAGTNSLGSVTNPPATASFKVNNLSAGNYTLTAVATDNGGASTTSAGIGIRVVAAGSLTVSSVQHPNATTLQFNYTATPGLSYVVDRSADLRNWVPQNTNTAATASVTFSDNAASASANFYRVRLLPNP